MGPWGAGDPTPDGETGSSPVVSKQAERAFWGVGRAKVPASSTGSVGKGKGPAGTLSGHWEGRGPRAQ